jgi:hypothetical protein
MNVDVNVVEGPAGLLLFEKLGIEIVGEVAPGERPRRDQLRVTNPDGSVYAGQLLSPSALGTGEKCERQFGYIYIDKLPRLTTKAQEVGTATHAELEAWLIEGVPPRTPLLTSSGALSHFPSPKTRGLEVETVFAFRATLLRIPEALDVPGAREALQRAEDVSAVLYGYKDAQLVSPDLDAVTVFDLKTTSSLAWAKTPDELLCDTQSVVYGIDGLLSAPGAMAVKLRWVYTQTKNAHCSRPTDVTMDWAHVEQVLANRVARAWRLGLLKERMEKGTAKTLKPNPRACGDYGGCQFLPLCDDLSTATGFLSLSRQTRLEGERKALPATAHKGNTMVSILAKMKSDLAKKGVAAEAVEALEQAAPTVAVSSTVTPAAATPPSAPVVAPSAPAPAATTPAPTSAPNALKSALAKLKGEVPAPAPAAPAPAAPAPAAPSAPAPAALPTGINPPDARPPGVVDPAPAAPEKRKPGRPKKVVEAELSAAPEVPAAPAPATAPATAPLPREWAEAELPASLAAPFGFTLLLDVAPVKGLAFRNIEHVLAGARTKVEAEAGMSYRLIDYGKGPAFLAEQLEEDFRNEAPNGAFFASSYSLDKEVLDVLMRHAFVVFRPTR